MLGTGSTFQPYLSALMKARVNGKWLSCLTDSDLINLGIEKIGHRRIILSTVESLVDDFNGIEIENLLGVLFSVVHRLGVVGSLLKQLSRNSDIHTDLEHGLFKAVIGLGSASSKAATWMAHSPFNQVTKLSALRAAMIQETLDVGKALQSALSNKKLGPYANAMLKIVLSLQRRLEEVIRNCDDSLMLTPCSIVVISLQKPENGSYVREKVLYL